MTEPTTQNLNSEIPVFEPLQTANNPLVDNEMSQHKNFNGDNSGGRTKIWPVFMFGFAIIIIAILVYIFVIKPATTNSIKESKLNEQKVIGLSLTSLRIERWKNDRDNIIAEAEKRGLLVNVTDANDDAALQISQAENLILQGVDVLIVIANNGETAAKIVEMAHQNGVKVIAYDRLILNSDLDYYVSFDSVDVGRKQAEGIFSAVGNNKNYAYIGGSPTDFNAILLKQGSMEVLKDKIDKGEIKLVYDVFIDDWKQEIAYQKMHDFLANGGKVDAVISANDGNATGVIQALKEFGLDGKVAVSGQDAELTACIRIVNGTQTVTIYKPLKELSKKAVEIADNIIKGENVKSENTIDNGKIDVPAIYIPVVSVNKNNIEETVIKDGFHKYTDIFE